MSKEFDYVIAHPWHEDEPDNLCIYAYGSEVQRGTMKDAKQLLKYVRSQKDDDSDQYAIYRITYEKIM
jgi:hypothetical protein